MWGLPDSYKQQGIGCGLSNQPCLITQLYQPNQPTPSMPASHTTASASLWAPASYNQHRSSTAHNNSSHPYPYYQDVYTHSINPAGDDGFPDLDLQDTRCISSFSERENAKENVMEIINFINTFIALDIVIGI